MDAAFYEKLGKKAVVSAAELLLQEGYDQLGSDVVAEIKKAIPGQVDDMILDILAPQFLPALKLVLQAKLDALKA